MPAAGWMARIGDDSYAIVLWHPLFGASAGQPAAPPRACRGHAAERRERIADILHRAEKPGV